MPTLTELYGLDEPAPSAGPQPSDDGDFIRGGKEAFQQLPQMGYGLIAGAGAIGEKVFGEGGIATGVKRAGLKGYTEWADKMAAQSKPSDSWSYSYAKAKDGDFGALVDWLQHGIGYAGAQGIQMLATAGIGAAGGKLLIGTAADKLASGMVAKEAARLAAENATVEATKRIAADQISSLAVKNVASKLGQLGAVGALATGQEGGEIFGGLVQKAEEEGTQLSGGDLARAFGATLAAGALEFVGDKLGLDVLLGRSKLVNPAKAMTGLGGRAARGVLAGAAVAPAEAATEYFQTGIEEYGKGTETNPLPWLQSPENQAQAFDAAALSGLGGAMVGGAGGAVHGAQTGKREEPVANIEDIATAPSIDEAIIAADKAVRGEPTRGERVANIKSELSDRAIVGDLRTKYGDDGFSQLLTSLNQANNPRTPEATREKHLQAVETALFNLRASVDQPAQTALLEGQQAMPMLTGPDGLPLLGNVSTPTGTMRAGPDGVAVPETAADLTETMRARDERTSLGEQQGQMPDDVIPMGMRQEQPAWTNPRSKAPEPTIIDALNVPNAVNAYVDRQRAINTPMAHAFVQAFDSGRITPADVAKLIVPSQQETPNDRIAAAAATAPQTLQQRLEAFRRAPDATTIETPVVASRPRPKGAPDAIGGTGTVQDMAQGQPEQAGRPAAAPAPGSADALPVGVQSEPDAALSLRERADAMRAKNAPAVASAEQPAVAPEKPRVFKSRKNAIVERDRLGNEHKLQKIKGGYILRRKTDKEMAAEARAGRRFASGAASGLRRSLLATIAAGGGLNISERPDTIGEGNRNVGGRMVFTRAGKTINQWAETLAQSGFIPPGEVQSDDGVRWLQDAIGEEFAGRREHFAMDDEARMEEAARASQGEEPAPDDALAPLSDFDLEELSADGYAAASPEVQALTEQVLAAADEAGIDIEALREDAARLTEGLSDDEYHAQLQASARAAIAQTRADAARSDAGADQASKRDRGASADTQGDEGAAPEGLKPGGRRAPRPFDPVSREFEHAGKTWRITVDRYWKIDSIEERYEPDLLTWTARVKKEYYGTSMFEPVASDAVPAAVAKKASEFFENVRALDAGERDLLTPQDAKSLREKTEREAAAKVADAKQKADEQRRLEREAIERETRDRARQDASAENFVLGQDANDALAGQSSIFDLPQPDAAARTDSQPAPDGETAARKAEAAAPARQVERDERDRSGLDAADRRRRDLDAAADELAGQIANDMLDGQYATPADRSEIAPGLRHFAEQGSVPADDLRQEVLKRIRADERLTKRQTKQIVDALDPTRQSKQVTAAPAKPISDVGEKIGGARKDTAVSSGARAKRSADDERPAWARRFAISQIVKGGPGEEGKWVINDTKNTNFLGQPKQIGPAFASKDEAEAFVPIAAVGLKHAPVPTGGGKYAIWRRISDRRRVKVVDREFDTRDAALAYMLAHAQAIIETNTTFGEADLPPAPDRARTGPPRRDADVTGDDFKETFGLRGVEFGNWNNQAERQALMNDAWDALSDLADVLGIPAKAIGLNGELALAFGARGHGLGSARAHYERNRAVINLTKERGAGTLAHEWFHSLDHYFGRQDGKASATWIAHPDGTRTLKVAGREDDYASHGTRGGRSGMRSELRTAYANVMQVMAKKAETYVEDTAKADNFIARARADLAERLGSLRDELASKKDPRYYKRNAEPASAEQLAEFDTIAKTMLDGEATALAREWRHIEQSRAAIASRWTNDSLERLSAINKAVRGRNGFDRTSQSGPLDKIGSAMNRYSERLKMLADAQSGAEKQRAVPTSFAMNARELDQGRGEDYWTTPHEMAARAFQGYVEDKIAERGGVSRFLNYAPENAGILTPWGVKRPYPSGDERLAINRAFDALVAELKTRETDKGVALYSRADTDEARALRALSENDELFDYPRGVGQTVAEVAASIDPGIRVISEKSDGRITRYVLRLPSGKAFSLRVRSNKAGELHPSGYYGYSDPDADPQTGVANRPGEDPDGASDGRDDVIIDVSALEQGQDGVLAYLVASDYAANTGRVFIGDPQSLSDAALLRRTEQMLSSAIKWGSTDHLAPHPRQVAGDAKLGIPPLAWDAGDTLGNIRSMVDVVVTAWENKGAPDIEFNPRDGSFTTGSDPRQPIDRAGMQRLAAESRAFGRGARAGDRTLARTAVWRALLREEGRAGAAGGRRDGLLARLVQAVEQFPAALGGAFYGRAAANNTGPSTREALRAALEREFGADVIDTLEKAGLLSVANVPPASMPSDVAGATEGERIRLFAANTPAGSTAVAYHEALHAALRRMIGDAAFEALMQRMPLLTMGNRKWFAEAADRIPADTPKSARNSELASYAVEQYQLAREAMPVGVRKWVQDLIAAIKVGLGKALQAAGVGLKLRVRLLSDAAVLHKLARDGLRTMAREAGQDAQRGLAPAFSVAPKTDSAAFRKWFGDSKVVENGLEELLSKPDGVGVLLRDLLAAQNATGSGLNPVQALMLALAKNDKIGRSIVGLVPVDVVNSFSKDGLRPKDGGGNTSMFVNALNAPVSDQVLSTFRGILTSLSTKLANAIATGRDQEIAPALLASDFNLREVGGLLSLQGSTDFWGGNTGVKSVSAGEAAKSTSPGLGSPAKDFKLDATALADLFNKFVSFAPHAKTSTSDDLPSAKYIAKQGRPLVVYHGTSGDFNAFDPEAEPETYSSDRGKQFFTTSRIAASEYATNGMFGERKTGANVMPVFLSMQNPLVHHIDGNPSEEWDRAGVAIWNAVEDRGHDGAIIISDDTGERLFVTSRPEQIKSATGNRGAFDPANPDIRYSRAAPASAATPAPTGLAAAAQRLRNAGGGTRIIGQTARQYTPEQLAAMRNVGFQVEAPTLEERIKALWKDAGKKLAQGLVDQFAPVKAISEEAYGLLRLAKGASGAFETLLKGGKLKLTEGVYDFDDTDKGGVIESLLIPLQGEHHDFLRWVAANRAERLVSEGKENLFSDDDIDNLKSLSDGTTDFDYTIQHGASAGQVTRDRTLIYEDSLKTFNGFNKNVLDMAEQSGLIDAESRKVWEHEFYVPFYRVADEDDGGVKGMNVRSGAVRQEAFKRLKGGRNELNADLLDNTLMNWAHLLDASAKNRAAKATLEAAEQMGAAISSTESAVRDMGAATQKKNGVVWVMDEGVKRFYLVGDPYLLQALVGLEYAGMRGPMMKAMGAFKHALTVGVTASPFFKIRNLIRDSVQAIGTGPISYNPAANVAQGWALTDPKSDAYFRLLAGGGTIHFGTMMEGNEAKRVQALVESGVDRATILNDQHKLKAFYRKFIEPGVTAYNELGNRGEAINRASLYAQLRAQGVGHAEASLQARDLMDFSMQGSFTSIRFLTQVVPFLNARIQGLYKLGRAAKEDPARIGAVLGATTLASLSLLLAFGDDDDWKKREDWDRNNFWWFKFGGMAFRIPKPFEIGAIATLAERGFELAFDKEMTGTRFRGQVLKLLGDNLAMNPVPQLVKPMLDVYANVNSFTGRPIETMSMERLRPQYRFTDRTSMTARAASTAANAVTGLVGADGPSPVQIDHMLRGYFGWLGTFVVGTADVIARPATGQPSQPAPDVWRTATGGMVSDLRDAPSRYVSQMYEQARVIEEAYGTWRALLKSGEGEEAREFFEDNRETILKRRLVERQKSALTEMNQRIRAIERSNDMTADEKRAAIRLIQSRKDMAARVTAMAR